MRVDQAMNPFELPELIVPTAVLDLNGYASLSEGSSGTPLVDSRWSFTDQCRALINSQAYLSGEE